jgi:tetratricopeptide (TPR) repeat protein
VQDASVLGKIFRRDGIKALSGVAGDELDDVLASLVRKEVLGVQSDLSPERGQYGFLQDLVRRVAYDTLSKRERKQKHLAAAAFIESAWGPDEEEFVEVVAAHCLEAHRLAPDDEYADEIRAKARAMLARAGERAASIAAPAEAQRYFEEAAELTDGVERAELLEQAGIMAARAGRSPEAIERFESAARLLEDAGLTHPAARVSARAAGLMWQGGRLSEAVGRMDAAFSVLVDEGADADLAALAAELGRLLFFSGQPDPALERIEWALRAAEAVGLPEIISRALNTKAVILYSAQGRLQEGLALLRHALQVALESDVQSAALRAYFNLADLAACSGHYREAAQHVARGLALSRRIGDRFQEWLFLGQSYGAYMLGEWDEVLAAADAMPPEAPAQSRVAAGTFLVMVPLIHVARGDLEAARAAMRRYPDVTSSADVQEVAQEAAGRAALLCAEGRYEEALSAAREALDLKDDIGLMHEALQEAFVVAADAAASLGDLEQMERLLRVVEDEPAGMRPQYMEAHAMRVRSRIAERVGELEAAEAGLRQAAGLFRELEAPFWTAVAELELAERLTAWGRADEAAGLLGGTRDVFERLGAKPWLERLEALASSVPAGSST